MTFSRVFFEVADHVMLCLLCGPILHPFLQVLMVNSLIQTPKSEELSSALLSVFLDRAADLPVSEARHTLSLLYHGVALISFQRPVVLETRDQWY